MECAVTAECSVEFRFELKVELNRFEFESELFIVLFSDRLSPHLV